MAFIPKKKHKSRKSKAGKPSKNLRKAVKTIMNKTVETKTINVPTSSSTTANTVSLNYLSGVGLQYLVQDVFKVPQGVNDSTAILSNNRIGDKIKGIGFLMDYYIHTYTLFNLVTTFQIPFVKIRISVWKQAFGSPLLTAPLLYDTNFLLSNTSTLQPINWDEGYVKDVIYDKVFVIKNQLYGLSSGGPSAFPLNSVFHFKKYIKYDHSIKYVDNNTLSPTSTATPIYITMSAEVDDANTFVPSSTKILNTTGYTRAWFKDA